MSRFELPVVKGAGGAGGAGRVGVEELVRRGLHLEETYEGQLGEKVGLAFGVAIVGEEFPNLVRANQVRDVTRVEGVSVEEMVRAVDDVFGGKGLSCRAWHFAGGKGEAEVMRVLEGMGYRREVAEVWALHGVTGVKGRTDLSVIPGRASYRGVAEVTEAVAAERYGKEVVAEMVRASERVLDERVVESLLALEGGRPVGLVNMVVEGEMGFIAKLATVPGRRRAGVGTVLIERAIELAARSRLKHVTLTCAKENVAGRGLYEKMGFLPVAEVEGMVKTVTT